MDAARKPLTSSCESAFISLASMAAELMVFMVFMSLAEAEAEDLAAKKKETKAICLNSFKCHRGIS